MYQNTVAVPRLDLAGAVRVQDALGDAVAHLLMPIFPTRLRQANVPSVLVTNGGIIDIKHAPKTPYQRVQTSLGNKTYACEEAGIEVPMSAEDYEVLGLDGAEQVSTEQSVDIILTGREAAVADALTGATGETLFAGQVSQPDSGENWGESGGLPIDDINEANAALSLRIGVGPRWLLISQYDLEDLQVNSQIRTEFRRIVGQSDPDAVNLRIKLETLAAILGVDRVIVGSRRKDTANKGQTPVWAYIWPARYAILFRPCLNPADLREPALGRIFRWEGQNIGAEGEVVSEDAQLGISIESYRDEPQKSDIIRGTEYTHAKVLNITSGELIKLPADD